MDLPLDLPRGVAPAPARAVEWLAPSTAPWPLEHGLFEAFHPTSMAPTDQVDPVADILAAHSRDESILGPGWRTRLAPDQPWLSFLRPDDEGPEQNWKLHVSSTVDSGARILDDTADVRRASPHPAFLVHLDVGAELLPRIGLEFLLERHVQLAGAIAEAPLLDLLVARDLCSPDKRAALERWPGHVVEPLAHGQRLGIRRLNSIKLVWDATGVVHAKAYLVMLDVTTAEPPRHAPLDRPPPS